MRLVEPDVVKRFKLRYPDGNVMPHLATPATPTTSTGSTNNSITNT